MKLSHIKTIQRYDEPRNQARDLAKKALPQHLKCLKLAGVDNKALVAFRAIERNNERLVNWDWNFATKYCVRYPKPLTYQYGMETHFVLCPLADRHIKGQK